MDMDIIEVPRVAVEQLAPRSYLRQIAYVPQEPCPPFSVMRDPAAQAAGSQADLIFRDCLEGVNDLLKKNQIPLRTAFFSYAWEDQSTEAGQKANLELQCFLKRLSQDLSRIAKDLKSPAQEGRSAVFFDLEHNTGHIETWISQSVDRSDYFLIVGTPRYRERVLSKTNLAFEYEAILKKVNKTAAEHQPRMLVPLLYKGSLSASFPKGLSSILVRSFDNPRQYAHHLLGFSEPVGLVPHLYPEFGKTGVLHAEYKALVDRMNADLQLLSQKHPLKAAPRDEKKEGVLLTALREAKANRSRLPHIESQLIGRADLLKSLTPAERSKGQAAITVCMGMAGVGKTTLVLQHAHHEPSYTARVWLRAGNADLLSTDYLALAKDLGYGASDLNEAKTYVNEVLEAHSGWLLVFDDAPDFQTIKSYLPPETGSVILTTRYRVWPNVFRRVAVDCLEPPDGVALLQSLSSAVSPPVTFESLAKRLGYLPLALTQAGVYMERAGVDPAVYLKMYDTQVQHILLLAEILPDAPSVAGTLAMTLERLKQETGDSSALIPLLQMMAYLEAEHIPRTVLVKALTVLGIRPSKSAVLEVSVLSLLARMQDYSLIKHNDTHLSMHPLLQDVIRAQYPLTEPQYVQLCEVLDQLFWEPSDDFRGKHNIALLPHLLRLTEHRHLYRAHPKKVALSSVKILSDIGRVYRWQLAKIPEAKAIFEEVLRIQESYQKPSDPQIAITLRNLASAELSLGLGGKAKMHLKRAFEIQRKYYGLNHVEVAATLVNIGRVCGAEGDFLQYKTFLHQAQELYNRSPDLKAEQASILMELAQVEDILGDKASSIDLFKQAVDHYQQYYGHHHGMVGTALRYLGNAYGSSGDHLEKKALLQRALKIQEQYYGSKDPEVALTLVDLGNVQGALGEARDAKRLLERALFIQESYYGAKHLHLALTLSDLGGVHSLLGDFEGAKGHLERARAIQKAYPYQVRYIDEVFTLVALGNVQGSLGNYQANKVQLEEALGIQAQHQGLQDLTAGMIYLDLGMVCETLEERAESKKHFKQAYEVFVRHYGKDHLYTQQALKAYERVVVDG